VGHVVFRWAGDKWWQTRRYIFASSGEGSVTEVFERDLVQSGESVGLFLQIHEQRLLQQGPKSNNVRILSGYVTYELAFLYIPRSESSRSDPRKV